MKKINISILLIICLSLVGCSSFKDAEKVELDSNPTTGYIWSYNLKDESLIDITRTYKSDCEKDDNIVGCGGKDIYTIKGLKKGEDTITFEYVRGEPQKNDKRVTYKIKVNKDLKVKLIKQK